MNKIELARAIQEACGCTQTEAAGLLNTVIDVFTEQLSNGNSINLQGFGTLNRSTRHHPSAHQRQIPSGKVSAGSIE